MQNSGQLEARVEIYKIFVETAERNVERRSRVNQFYFSLVAALFVAYSYLVEGKLKVALSPGSGFGGAAVPAWALPLFLLVISMSWFSVLLSFRALSKAKYMVIDQLESELPSNPFVQEWRHYKELRTIETTQIELLVPLLFYIAAVVGLTAPFL